MFHLFKKLASTISNAADGKVRVFVDDTGKLATKDETGAVVVYGTGSGGGASVPTIRTVTANFTIGLADMGNLIIVDSAANVNGVIANDVTLALAADSNQSFRIFYKQNGIAVVTHISQPVTRYAGYPTAALGVTEKYHHTGVNLWAAE